MDGGVPCAVNVNRMPTCTEPLYLLQPNTSPAKWSDQMSNPVLLGSGIAIGMKSITETEGPPPSVSSATGLVLITTLHTKRFCCYQRMETCAARLAKPY